VIAEPPLLFGALQLTEAVPPVPLPVTPVGDEGRPAGVTAAEADELDAELPALLVAVEVKV
jgi:hypothetical protein